MKVIEKKTIVRQVLEIQRARLPWQPEIDYIELTTSEWDQFKREAGVEYALADTEIAGISVRPEHPAYVILNCADGGTFKFPHA